VSIIINTKFDFYSDTPKSRDPDSYSPTLRRYHKALWSKPLPNGSNFYLSATTPKAYLHHQPEVGEFFLSSDAIGHTYSRTKRMSHVIEQIPDKEIASFFAICSTIGGYILFPSNKIDNKMTINASRGLNRSLKDRFDLTLECIRQHYQKEDNPLDETFQRYSGFFDLFQNFRGYVDFFLLQDLVNEDYSQINFYLPFNGFDGPPLPSDAEEYRSYKHNVTKFITARNQRIRIATQSTNQPINQSTKLVRLFFN